MKETPAIYVHDTKETPYAMQIVEGLKRIETRTMNRGLSSTSSLPCILCAGAPLGLMARSPACRVWGQALRTSLQEGSWPRLGPVPNLVRRSPWGL